MENKPLRSLLRKNGDRVFLFSSGDVDGNRSSLPETNRARDDENVVNRRLFCGFCVQAFRCHPEDVSFDAANLQQDRSSPYLFPGRIEFSRTVKIQLSRAVISYYNIRFR